MGEDGTEPPVREKQARNQSIGDPLVLEELRGGRTLARAGMD